MGCLFHTRRNGCLTRREGGIVLLPGYRVPIPIHQRRNTLDVKRGKPGSESGNKGKVYAFRFSLKPAWASPN